MRAKKIIGTEDRPRIVISESNRYITVQAIDDTKGETIIYLDTRSFSSNSVSSEKSKKNIFYLEKLIDSFSDKMIKKNKIDFLFDRNGRVYKGKISIFCNGLRRNISSFVNNREKI